MRILTIAIVINICLSIGCRAQTSTPTVPSFKKVEIGMSAPVAKSAGGPCVYKVIPDKKWQFGADPLLVIANQDQYPDDSQIWLTFQNTVQFDTPTPVAFRVYIAHGKVQSIDRLP